MRGFVYALELADVYEYGTGVGVLSSVEDVGVWRDYLSFVVNSVIRKLHARCLCYVLIFFTPTVHTSVAFVSCSCTFSTSGRAFSLPDAITSSTANEDPWPNACAVISQPLCITCLVWSSCVPVHTRTSNAKMQKYTIFPNRNNIVQTNRKNPNACQGRTASRSAAETKSTCQKWRNEMISLPTSQLYPTKLTDLSWEFSIPGVQLKIPTFCNTTKAKSRREPNILTRTSAEHGTTAFMRTIMFIRRRFQSLPQRPLEIGNQGSVHR
jgi:hypothetical protein